MTEVVEKIEEEIFIHPTHSVDEIGWYIQDCINYPKEKEEDFLLSEPVLAVLGSIKFEWSAKETEVKFSTGYQLDIVHIYKELQNYLQGRNPTEEYKYIAEKEEGVFGLKVYDDILDTDIGRREFLLDVRISYLLKEHKECMKLRIDYLYSKEMLFSLEYSKINNIMQSILKMSKVVLSLVLKNKITEKNQIQDRIWEYIKRMKEQEQECYTYLLNALKRHIEESGIGADGGNLSMQKRQKPF